MRQAGRRSPEGSAAALRQRETSTGPSIVTGPGGLRMAAEPKRGRTTQPRRTYRYLVGIVRRCSGGMKPAAYFSRPSPTEMRKIG